MKALWQYIKNPQENCSYDFSVKAILLSALLCLIVPLLFKVLTVSVFVLAGVDLPAMTSDKSVLPLCFLIVVPPIVEELGFRLPLKRGRLNLCISVALIAFVFSKVIFAGGLYSEHLFCRIGFAIIASSVINLILGKWLQNVRFKFFSIRWPSFSLCCISLITAIKLWTYHSGYMLFVMLVPRFLALYYMATQE